MNQVKERYDVNFAYEAYRASPDHTGLEEIIRQGEPLVRHFAKQYGTGCPSDDLYQSGMLGLMKAVKSYDGRSQFSTWASWCIISEIRHFARSEYARGSSVLTPLHNVEEEASCYFVYDTELTDRESAESMQADQSFHLRLEDKIALEQAMQKLTQQQKQVIDALFYRGMTQEQTASELRTNQRRVSRIKAKGLKILAELLREPNFQITDNTTSFKKI